MTLRILSRSSDLAVAQARQVGRALEASGRDTLAVYLSRTSAGDRDPEVRLADATTKGMFTADLSDSLAAGDADIVVHSWKDLPVAPRSDTIVAGTLERADVRDVLIVPRRLLDSRPAVLRILTSSPRRAWQAQTSLGPLLPWPVSEIRTEEVRGNVPTRLAKAVRDEAALIVAKAGLDRLLGPDVVSETRHQVRKLVDESAWMILPVSHFPAAPAQGALAIEVAASNRGVVDHVRAISHDQTMVACVAERAILERYGGGCHEAIGAVVIQRPYGRITTIRGRLPDGETITQRTLEPVAAVARPASSHHVWPGPGERIAIERVALTAHASTALSRLSRTAGLWITRADALPDDVTPARDQLVWASGLRTWRKLAARRIWVHGSADGLGDEEAPEIDRLAGRVVEWRHVTHARSGRPEATVTYDVRYDFPSDLGRRTHFFWTSGSAFLDALARYPAIRDGWHASGPGRTRRTITDALGGTDRASIWLDHDTWLSSILR
jgi:hydroxymethylbilane synthase